jgi:hypothetical protein
LVDTKGGEDDKNRSTLSFLPPRDDMETSKICIEYIDEVSVADGRINPNNS